MTIGSGREAHGAAAVRLPVDRSNRNAFDERILVGSRAVDRRHGPIQQPKIDEQLAAMVDQQMREIAQGALTADSLKVAILAALHIADELDKAKSKYEQLNEALATRSIECAEALDQILKNNK